MAFSLGRDCRRGSSPPVAAAEGAAPLRRRSGHGCGGRGGRGARRLRPSAALTARNRSPSASPSPSCSRRDVDIGQGGTAQTFLANTLSNADPIPVIYGSRRVGASVIEVGITATEVQADRLHRIAIWGEGPISAVQALYLDTVASRPTRASADRAPWHASSTTSAPTARRPRRR
jgi:hypothetical protein